MQMIWKMSLELYILKVPHLYGSSSTAFIDGTKMRLIPPFNSVISASDKGNMGQWLLGKQRSSPD
jgi:hypothetical protein